MNWRRKWQPTPVFLPGESHGQRSLVDCCLWGHTESDTIEATSRVAQTVKRLSTMRETRVRSWVGKILWIRKWQLTPVFLPGKSHGWRSPVGYTPWGRKELDMTEPLTSFYIPIMDVSEKAMAPHSSTLAWKIPWTEESGGLQSLGSLRVGHD